MALLAVHVIGKSPVSNPQFHFLAVSCTFKTSPFSCPIFLPALGPFPAFVTAAVTLLLRVCNGSDLNSDPILPRCYGCYGSKGG